MEHIVILGAGHGGVQLAASLRDVKFGGKITLVSDEADLPYHKPPLSKSYLKSEEAALQPLRGEAFFGESDVVRRFGEAVIGLDLEARMLRFEGGDTLGFDKLVLATGTRARKLPVPGADLPGTYYLRTAEDARQLRAALPQMQRIAVIGGGFIGLETAAMLRATGREVTVIEAAPHVLGRAVSADVALAVEAYLDDMGINLSLGAGVEGLTEEGAELVVALSDGAAINADGVIVGIGAEPVTELAEGAGISVANGVKVDAYMQSSVQDVYAIGDCVSFPQAQIGQVLRLESVQNATDQARALAATLVGTPTEFAALPWFWSDIGALKLQVAGLSHGCDDAVVIPHGAEKLSVYRFRDGALACVETLNCPAEHMLARRMIADGFTPDREKLTAEAVAGIKMDYMAWAKARKA